MEAICINCRYVGSVLNKKGLVCSQSKDFKSVNKEDTCNDFIQGICERCGSDDIGFRRFSPDDEPYVIRTEYNCNSCKLFWYEESIS